MLSNEVMKHCNFKKRANSEDNMHTNKQKTVSQQKMCQSRKCPES